MLTYSGDFRYAERLFENHGYVIAVRFVYYNFAKIYKTLLVQAGLIKRVMTIEDIVNPIPKPAAKERDSYKKGEPLNSGFYLL